MALFDFLRRDKEPTKRMRMPRQYRTYSGANTGRLFADFLASNNSADAELKPSTSHACGTEAATSFVTMNMPGASYT